MINWKSARILANTERLPNRYVGICTSGMPACAAFILGILPFTPLGPRVLGTLVQNRSQRFCYSKRRADYVFLLQSRITILWLEHARRTSIRHFGATSGLEWNQAGVCIAYRSEKALA